MSCQALVSGLIISRAFGFNSFNYSNSFDYLKYYFFLFISSFATATAVLALSL